MISWIGAIAGGLLLDLAIGDPVFALHPVRLIGALADRAEAYLRPRFSPRRAGLLSWLVVEGTIAAVGLALLVAGRAALGVAGEIAAGSLLVWASVAARDLGAHALRVATALEAGDLGEARRRVGMIVGRETANLDADGVARAAVESVAESYVDGVAAPLFWAALLGPLGAILYRGINTMDSMFGHKNDRYLDFGRFPARADDAATWVPARLAGLVACLAAPAVGGSVPNSLKIFFRDRHNHESPNSAHGESAFAGALSLRLGGPTVYAEGVVEKPFIGTGGGLECGPRDIRRALGLLAVSTLGWALIAVAVAWAF